MDGLAAASGGRASRRDDHARSAGMTDLAGRTFLITGANSGIGYATAAVASHAAVV